MHIILVHALEDVVMDSAKLDAAMWPLRMRSRPWLFHTHPISVVESSPARLEAAPLTRVANRGISRGYPAAQPFRNGKDDPYEAKDQPAALSNMYCLQAYSKC